MLSAVTVIGYGVVGGFATAPSRYAPESLVVTGASVQPGVRVAPLTGLPESSAVTVPAAEQVFAGGGGG